MAGTFGSEVLALNIKIMCQRATMTPHEQFQRGLISAEEYVRTWKHDG
jgi:hypothetical protein